ncbi:hypothetical protein GCM10007108_01370 [Thermogymnomonas acidicola]|uniref:Uncharacterized protein n=1 Tax=Thermogymnomonas acidicola TaxID=399579 RepID=A0AA37BPV3_9ARCH|nr:hypothetical protein [Thermogymnomonas acidicola]GGM66932.1 hypothetical protein GCM10007108_01370 [Thermogymnomonas acidicola]
MSEGRYAVLSLSPGSILVDRSLSGTPMVLRFAYSPGPCRDGTCQPIRRAVCTASTAGARGLVNLEVDGVQLSLTPEVAEEIRKGRRNVIIKRSITGKIRVSGI